MKTVILIIGLIFLAFTGSQNDVTIQADYKTDESDPNKILVSVSVLKGNLSEFGRYTHDLPEGFKAESFDNNFTFEDGKVKYIWINLPSETNFSFTYSIIIPEGYSGELNMDGTFAYVMNNQRMQAQIEQEAVALSPDSPVEYSAPKSEVSEQIAQEQPFNVSSQRKVVVENSNYKVYVKLNKADLNEMAKITENIPEGYTLKMDESFGGIHTYENNQLNVMWMQAPADEEFIISYELVPDDASKGKPSISGEFSYAHNGVTYSNKVEDGDFILPTEHIVNSNMMMVTKKKPATPKVPAVENLSEGLLFRVQIAASHQKVNTDSYFKRFNIYEPVFMHEHEGWQKYLVGNFDTYNQAKKHKKEVWSATPIKDAFVAAYNNGTRITVQEALMIKNQAIL